MASLDKFKITALTCDSDKDPTGFFIWMENMASLVRATADGQPLEVLLDSKLRRVSVRAASIPSFILNDPDFAVTDAPVPAPAEADDQPEDSDSASVSTFTLGSAAVAYSDLPQESKTLDALLYNVLKINVKGSRNSVISWVTFPSYVQAMCVLSKHMDISKTDRIMRALGAWDKLTFKNDVAAFQTEVMALKRELDASGANIVHFVMGKIMRAFDGKSKSIQFKIAEDLNKHSIDESLNMYDLIQTYCADLASVGDGNSAKVNAVEIACHDCGKKGHKRPDCPDLKKQKGGKGAAKKGGKGNGKQKGKEIACHGCGKKGVKRPDCPNCGDPPAPVAAPAPSNAIAPASSVNNIGLNQEALQSLVYALRNGSRPASGCGMVQLTPSPSISKPACSHAGLEAPVTQKRASDEIIRLSLCDGMGCFALCLKANSIKAD